MAYKGIWKKNDMQFKLSFYKILTQEIIQKFCTVAEPDFPSHNILEQYQAQVGVVIAITTDFLLPITKRTSTRK